MKHNMVPTLSPEEAIRLGLMRPICEQENLKSIGKAFMEHSEIKDFGSTSFILTLLQICYHAGRIEGIRAERSRKSRTNP